MTPNESYDILYEDRIGKSYKFLKNFKSHINIDEIASEINHFVGGNDFIADFKSIFDYFYLKHFHDLKPYKTQEILKNVVVINSKQYNFLSDKKFSIRYKKPYIESIDNISSETNYIYRNVNVNMSGKLTYVRDIILYYKCMRDIKRGEFDQIDTFHFCLLHNTIKRLIAEKKIATVNSIRVIPRYYGHLPDIINDVVCQNDIYNSDEGSNFPSISSIFAHTVHLQCQSELPDFEFGTVPVLSSPLTFCSKFNNSVNKFVRFPVSYLPHSISNGNMVVDGEYLNIGNFEKDNYRMDGIFNAIKNMVLDLDEMNMNDL